MKPASFVYLAPTDVGEVLALLGQHGGEGKLLAGGQSLVPLLNFRLARPAVLVDLNRVPGLATVRHLPDTNELALGPMVRLTDAEGSALVRQHCPLLVEAVRHVGHRAIRNRGTIGGSLAHADPAAELPLALVALDGRVRLSSSRGERWLAAHDFFVDYLTTALKPDELLVEARFPSSSRSGNGQPGNGNGQPGGWGFAELSRRHGDFALAAVAATLDVDHDGRISHCAVAVAGAGPTPVRRDAGAQSLVGQVPREALLREIGAAVAAGCEGQSDLHASAAYRRSLIATLTERALHQATVRSAQAAAG